MSKISELSDGGSIQSGDTLIAVRSGGNVKVTYGGTTTADINGGTIDGAVIGGSSAAAGTFTSITGTSANINGTVTADGLTVDSSTSSTVATFSYTGGTDAYLGLDGTGTPIYLGNKNGEVVFQTSGSGYADKLKIANNGDISFYEDTGTTAKFFWDASAESLGIGTTSPSEKLEIFGNALLTTGYKIYGNANTGLTSSYLSLYNAVDGGIDLMANYTTSKITFGTAGSERMRIDSSGNLLVGTTDGTPYASNVKGAAFYNSGAISGSVDGLPAMYLNRKTSDGTIADFRKDGTTVGSIGSYAGAEIFITGGTSTTSGVVIGDNLFVPCSANGGTEDGLTDLGSSGRRWQDVYATNGTIQTSDANEKQDIEALSEAEQRVAVAAKGLLRKFRWKSAVAEKGDDARIHFGIIAQDLQAAFEAEGLDAGRYAMFIHSTWTDEETGEERSRMGVRYSELLAFIIAAI